MNADLLARGFSVFLNYLAEPALRSLLLACVAASGLAACRVQRVRARLMVCTAVLCAALAMPLLGAFVPRLRVAVPAAWMSGLRTSFERGPVRALRNDVTASHAVVRSAETAARSSAGALGASGSALDRPLRRVMKMQAGSSARAKAVEAQAGNAAPVYQLAGSHEMNGASRPAATIRRAATPSSTPRRSLAIPWTALLLGIYLVGFGVLLARVVIGWWLSARLGRAAGDIEDREALRVLRYRAAFAGLADAPRLKESAAVAVPATVGVRRAVILLPANWRTWTGEQFDAIVAHEVSHVARRDALVQLLSLIHRAIFWFSPLGWWLDRQLTDLAEQASDEAALAGGADRARYAETLVGFFAQLGAAPRRVWWQGVSMAKAAKMGSAERRVGRILAWRQAMSMKKSFAVALVAVAAPIIFAAASVDPFIARAQDKPPAPPQGIVQPGGPVAPVLPKAPKAAGVRAVPMPPAPPQGVGNPGPPPAAPVLAGAPSGPLTGVPSQRATPGADRIPAKFLNPDDAPVVISQAWTEAGEPSPNANGIGVPGPGPTSYWPAVTLTNDADEAVVAVKLRFSATSASQAITAVQVRIAPHASYTFKQNSIMQGRPEDMRVQLLGVQFEDGQVWGSMNAPVDARQTWVSVEPGSAEQGRSFSPFAVSAPRAAIAPGAPATVAPVPGYAPSTPVAAMAPGAALEPAQVEAGKAFVNGSYSSYGGGRYVIMSGGDESVEMSGDDEDFQHARELRRKLGTDLIWFERDEKSYVITDAGFIAKAKALFAPEDALSKQQDELSRQQDALSKQQDALSEKQDSVKVTIPDISPDIKRVQDELDALRQSGATQEELGRLQAELGRLQSRMGTFQSEAGAKQSEIGRQQSELGRQQGELGRKQGELGRQQGEIARKASIELRHMFDEAIANGTAKLE